MFQRLDISAELDRFDPQLPVERAVMPPSSWYAAPDIFELEKQAVFGRSWQRVARSEELAQPGAYVSGCLAGQPWVVVRGQDGALRAFANVCRHKGREVVTGSGVVSDALVCGYHAWSYELTGRLKSAPRIGGIVDFDRESMSLPRLAVEIWGPWVFINGDLEAPPLAPRLSALHQSLERGGLKALRYYAQAEWTLRCNWKVYVDNYLDGGYHIPHMHPTLDAQLDMTRYRTELYDGFSVQTCAPAEQADARLDYDAKARIGDGAIYAWLYPNFMLNRYGPCLDTNYVVPLGHDQCKVIYEFYFLDGEGESAREMIRRSMAQSEVTQQEDIEICESVQRGLSSRSYLPGRYAPRVEHGEHQFHRLLHADLVRAMQNPSAP